MRSVLLAWICGTAGLAWAAPATAPNAAPVIGFAEKRPVIDGDLSDGCWKDAARVRADYLYGSKDALATRPRMIVRYAWDADYLYIAYETFDRNLVALGNGKEQGPAGNRRQGLRIRAKDQRPDVVEFFIVFDDVDRSWEVHHNAANQFNDMVNVASADGRVRIDDEKSIEDLGGCTLKTAVKLKAKPDGTLSTVNDDRDVDAGYTAEMRIPWAGLRALNDGRAAFKARPGAEVRLLAVCQDLDEQRYYTHSSATFDGKRFASGGRDFPMYRLEQKP